MALFLSLDLDSLSTFRDFSFYCAQLGVVRSIITRPSALKARPHVEEGYVLIAVDFRHAVYGGKDSAPLATSICIFRICGKHTEIVPRT
jgi:hypothetical protein